MWDGGGGGITGDRFLCRYSMQRAPCRGLAFQGFSVFYEREDTVERERGREIEKAEFAWKKMDIAAFPWRYVSSVCLATLSHMDGCLEKREQQSPVSPGADSQRETDTSARQRNMKREERGGEGEGHVVAPCPSPGAESLLTLLANGSRCIWITVKTGYLPCLK